MAVTEPGRRRDSGDVGEQGLLFEDEVVPPPEDIGYRGHVACAAAGITYRQLDYWARTGFLEPSIQPARGSGSHRLYSFRDILVLRVVKSLLKAGVSLTQIKSAVAVLRDHGITDLARVTLMSDGATVYACTSRDEVVDLLQGGQGVFGIALGRIWQEVEGSLAEFPASNLPDETPADESGPDESGAEPARQAADELASRRARKTS